MLLDLGLLALAAMGGEGRTEPCGGHRAGCPCEEQARLEERREGAEGRRDTAAPWETAEAPDVPWGGAREGERNRVPGHGGSGGGEVGRVMLLWLLLCYS